MTQKPATAQKTGLEGSLQERPLETLIFGLYQKNASGQIVLKRGDGERRLFFRDGHLIFVHSSLENENPVSYLREQGILNFEQAKTVNEKDEKSPIRGLALFGITDSKELGANLERFVEKVAVAAFAWQDGQFSLQALPGQLAKVPVLKPVNPVGVISKGIKQHYQLGMLGMKFAKIQDRMLIFTPEFKNLYANLEFSPQEQKFMSRIDGKTTIGQLATTTDCDTLNALQLIWILFSLRMVGMAMTDEQRKAIADAKKKEEEEKKAKIEQAKPQAPKEVPLDPVRVKAEIEEKSRIFAKQNYFEILNVPRQANRTQIHAAYMSLAKRFHPDVMIVLGLKDFIRKTGEVFAKMTQAYETLSDDKRRKEYEATLDIDSGTLARMNDIVMAESEFVKGEMLLKSRSYDAALQQFKCALNLNPDEAEHHVYYAWTVFLINQKGNKQTAADEAKKSIKKALKMRANVDMAHYFLGQIAKSLGNNREAHEAFSEALNINPRNELADAELRVMQRKK